jgi:hypothetical protein
MPYHPHVSPEPTMADEVAVVGLEADASEFDKALEESSKSIEDWGKSVADSVKPGGDGFRTLGDAIDKFSGRFETMRNSLSGRVEGLLSKITEMGEGASAKLEGIADLTNQQLSQSLGSGLGTLLGSRFGLGGLGEAIGKQVGDGLADVVDFKNLADGATELLNGLKPIIASVKSSIGTIFNDLSNTFSEVKDLAKSVGLGEILRGDFTGAVGKITTFLEQAANQWQGFFFRFAAHTGDAMDGLWSKIKEPIARVADFIQAVLVKIGLLNEGTGKWGDSIRSVGEIAKTVFGAVAYAIGFLGGFLKIIGGEIQQYILAPLVSLVENVVSLLSKVFEKVAANVGGAVGRRAADVAKFLKEVEDNIAKTKDALREEGRKNQEVDPFAAGEKAREEFNKQFKKGKGENDDLDKAMALIKGITEYGKEQYAAVAGIFKSIANAKGPAADVLPRTTVQASVEGTTQAANEIAKARAFASTDAAKQIAVAEKQAEELAFIRRAAEGSERLNQQIADKLSDVGTV